MFRLFSCDMYKSLASSKFQLITGKGVPTRQILGKSKILLGLLEGIPTMLKGEVAMVSVFISSSLNDLQYFFLYCYSVINLSPCGTLGGSKINEGVNYWRTYRYTSSHIF